MKTKESNTQLLNKLITDGKKFARENNEPTEKEIKNYRKVVFDFIVEKKRLLYGGTAQHFLFQENGHPGIYENEYEYDYDFYTPNPIGDSIEIANKLYEKGFPMVKRFNALAELTYKTSVNTDITIADISYMPINIYKNIQKLKLKNGCWIIGPEFMFVDLYKALSDPPRSLFRWEKDMERLHLIEKTIPKEKIIRYGGFDNYKMNYETPQKVISLVLDYLKNINHVVMLDEFAYNFYIQNIPKKTGKTFGKGYDGNMSKTKLEYLTFYSVRPIQDICNIIDQIKSISKPVLKKSHYDLDDFSIYFYSGYMKHFASRFVITYCKEIIIEIIEPKTHTLPFRKNKEFRVASYHLLIYYYYVMISISDEEKRKIYRSKILDLKNGREKYYKRKNERNYEGPYAIFLLDKDTVLETKYVSTFKLNHSGVHKSNYIPEIKKEKPIPDNDKTIKKYYHENFDKKIGYTLIGKYKFDEFLEKINE